MQFRASFMGPLPLQEYYELIDAHFEVSRGLLFSFVFVTTALARCHCCQRKVFPKGKRNVTIECTSEPSEPIKAQKTQTLGVTNKTMIR